MLVAERGWWRAGEGGRGGRGASVGVRGALTPRVSRREPMSFIEKHFLVFICTRVSLTTMCISVVNKD